MDNARSALRADQPDQAIADADASLRVTPNGPPAAEALYVKGVAYYLKASNRGGGHARDPLAVEAGYEDARVALTQAVKQTPPPELEGLIRAELATVAFYQEDFPTAIQQADAALALDPPPARRTAAGVLVTRGRAQQRLGRFDDADRTFAEVQKKYAGTPEADAAARHVGQRLFYVRVGTYASALEADPAAAAVRQTGSIPARQLDPGGQTTISAGPFSTYDDAKRAMTALTRQFPTAVVVP